MTAGSHLPHAAGYGDAQDRRPFIESHRALAVRTREFERLIDGVVRGASTVRGPAAPGEDVAVVRRAPDRCVVQLGPVALTIAWLRSTIDSVAEGQLLVIVWRGVIAPTGPYAPDRTTALASPVRSATALWEEVLTATAVDEATWLWRPAGVDVGGHSSSTLVARYLERLRDAYAGATPAEHTS